MNKTHWEIVEYATHGNSGKSVPDSVRNEMRAFGILKSTQLNDPADSAKLLDGWHELEENRWRWTARRFAVELMAAAGKAGEMILRFEFSVHERLLAATGRVKIEATVNGVAVEAAEYRIAGRHVYQRRLGASILREGCALVRFELDTAIDPDASDPRERGLIASSIRLDPIQGDREELLSHARGR